MRPARGGINPPGGCGPRRRPRSPRARGDQPIGTHVETGDERSAPYARGSTHRCDACSTRTPAAPHKRGSTAHTTKRRGRGQRPPRGRGAGTKHERGRDHRPDQGTRPPLLRLSMEVAAAVWCRGVRDAGHPGVAGDRPGHDGRGRNPGGTAAAGAGGRGRCGARRPGNPEGDDVRSELNGAARRDVRSRRRLGRRDGGDGDLERERVLKVVRLAAVGRRAPGAQPGTG